MQLRATSSADRRALFRREAAAMRLFALLLMLLVVPSQAESTCRFQGVYEGKYLAEDTRRERGVFRLEVRADGEFRGTFTSEVYSRYLELSGRVDESGELRGETQSGTIFNGRIDETVITGSWTNWRGGPGFRGTFEGRRY